jgi:hypothetical protein
MSAHIRGLTDYDSVWFSEVHEQPRFVLVFKVSTRATRHRRRICQRRLLDQATRNDVTSSIHTV